MKDLQSASEDIAIVGMACRFPGGVKSPKEFKNFLLKGGDGISLVPQDRWNNDAYFDADKDKKNRMYVNQGGFLSDIEMFEPQFFGISPKEAPSIDPQHRWLLELTYEALENAGLKPSELRGSNTAVYMGQFMHDYEQLQVDAMGRELISSHSATGPSMTLTANRISYTFDFTGPSVALDTACSSSLVALDLACQAIVRGDSHVAIAGGVNILLRPEMTMSICKASMLSPDGRCKSFDASANGYVRSEGAGVVVVKKYSDALRDGDPILALIKGTGVNQDGQTNGITVPNGKAQKRLLETTLARANMAPSDIQYLEAHGTGTAVGDPIEVNAMGSILRENRSPDTPCVIGSVKSNIGHAEAAAGMAGLMKAVLAINTGIIPRNIHFKKLNPAISLADLNLHLPLDNTSWPDVAGQPRRALVNSFGFGGTNSNVIIERNTDAINYFPETMIADVNVAWGRKYWLALSAKSEPALKALAGRYREFLVEAASHDSILDICYTAATRRDHYKYRLAITGTSASDMIEALDAYVAGEQKQGYVNGVDNHRAKADKVAFVFSGMGTQWVGMGRELYAGNPIFRTAMDRCDAALAPLTGWSLVDKLYTNPVPDLSNRTDIAQPAIFAVQYALTELLNAWGILPTHIVGHSAGEVAAAHASGALSFDDAINVIYHRSRLQFTTEGMGKMLAVGLTQGELQEYLAGVENKISIAAINSEDAITLAGDEQELIRIAERLDEKGIFARFLSVNVPYHSPVMDQLKEPLIDALADLAVLSPAIPIYSTVSGKRSGQNDWGAHYWADNVRNPVLFKDAIEAMIAEGVSDFIEVSAHPALSSSIEKILRQQGQQGAIVSCLKRDIDSSQMADRIIGSLYTAGIQVDWEHLYHGGKHTLLPNYTWQKSAYWSEDEAVRYARLNNVSPSAGVHRESHLLLGASVPSQVPLWQKTVALDELPFLADHRVDGDIVYPAAAYIDMALALAREIGQDQSVTVEDLAFHKALFLQESSILRMETLWEPDTRHYQIAARDTGADSWSYFSSGRISKVAALPVKQSIDVASIKSRLPSHYVSQEFYQHCLSLGLDYRDKFQAVQQAWFKDDESLVQIALPAAMHVQHQQHRLNPVILDGAFQGLFPTISSGYLPVAIRQLRFHATPGETGYAHLITHFKNHQEIYGDLVIANEGGDVVVEVLGISLKAINAGQSLISDLLYEFRWHEAELERTAVQEGHVLVVADCSGLGHHIREQLENAGSQVVLWDAQSRNLEDWENLLKESATTCKSIVYLPSLDMDFSDEMSVDHIAAVVKNGVCDGPLPFIQAMLRIEWSRNISLFLVTQGGQSTQHQDGINTLSQSTLWGLGRVLSSEHPEFSVVMVDLDNRDCADTIDRLSQEILYGGQEQEIAIRNGARLVNRLGRISNTELGHYIDRNVSLRPGDSFRVLLHDRPMVERSPRGVIPDGNEVLIRVDCASTFVSDWVIGNQYLCAGEIIATGSNIAAYPVGTRVLLPWHELQSDIIKQGTDGLYHVPDDRLLQEACDNAARQLWSEINVEYALTQTRPNTMVYVGPINEASVALIKRAMGLGVDITVCSNALDKLDLPGDANITKVNTDHYDWPELCAGQRPIDLLVYAEKSPVDVKLVRHLQVFATFLDWSSEPASTDVLRIVQEQKIHYLRLSWQDLIAHRERLIARCVARSVAMPGDAGVTPVALRDWLDAARQSSGFSLVDFTCDQELSKFTRHGKVTGIVRPDATYLVTGGLGGLGLAIMDWLVDEGAKSIVLTGRNEPNTYAQQAIARVQSQGIIVKVARADVTSESDIQQLVEYINAEMKPLRGVIHSAGVLDDGVIAQQTPEKFARVLASKVNGSWNLHRATRHYPLDIFVCFSSIAAVVGWPGQSNYAVANSFMDALCRYRQQQGLPALSINWGPWAEVGMASKLDVRDIDRMESSGMKALNPKAAVLAMQELLAYGVEQAGIFDMNWRAVFNNSASLKSKTLLSGFLEKNDQVSDCVDFASLYRSTPAPLRAALVQEKSCGILADILGFDDAAQIEVTTNLFEYGLNSLMAMDCKNRLQNLFAVKLPATLLLKHPTIAGFSEQCYLLLEAALNTSHEEVPTQETAVVEDLGELILVKEIDSIKAHQGRERKLAHYTLPVLMEIDTSRINIDALEEAFNVLVQQNEALRLRVSLTDTLRFSVAEGVPRLPLARVNIDAGQAGDLATVCDSLIANTFTFSVEDSLAKAYLLLQPETGKTRLLMVFHHWVSDGMSLEMIKLQLIQNYYQALSGNHRRGQGQSGLFKRMQSKQLTYVRSPEARSELDYWLHLPWTKVANPAQDEKTMCASHILPAEKHHLSAVFDKLWSGDALSLQEKAAIKDANVAVIPADETLSNFVSRLGKKGYSLEDAVVGAVTQVLLAWTSAPVVLVNLFRSGRTNDLFGDEILSSIGDFHYRCPLFVEKVEAVNVQSHIDRVHRAKAALPSDGLAYFALKHMADHPGMQVQQTPQFDINFTQRDFVAVADRTIEGITPLEISLTRNNPTLFADDRIYFEIGYREQSFYIKTVIKGFDYMESLFPGYFHPARAVALSEAIRQVFLTIMNEVLSESLSSTGQSNPLLTGEPA